MQVNVEDGLASIRVRVEDRAEAAVAVAMFA